MILLTLPVPVLLTGRTEKRFAPFRLASQLLKYIKIVVSSCLYQHPGNIFNF